MNIARTLQLRRGSRISLIGGGGKTTTMHAIASAGVEQGMRVLVTTTTKMWATERGVIEISSVSARNSATVRRALDAHGAVVVGKYVDPDGKVHGLECEWVCPLGDAVGAHLLLCEADGSAGRPIKVHGPGEPVVPECTTHLLVLAGMDALGASPDSSHIHRMPAYEELFGPSTGERITAGAIATVLQRAALLGPSHAKVYIVLNKTDDAAHLEGAAQIAREPALLQYHVIAAKRGHVVANFGSPADSRQQRA